MKLIHCSDMHIQPQTWATWSAVRDDAYLALHKARLGVEKHLRTHGGSCSAAAVLSGDVFSTKRPFSKDLYQVQELTEKWLTYHIKGNHDDTELPLLGLFSDTHYIGDRTQNNILELSVGADRSVNCRIAGIDFTKNRDELLTCLNRLVASGFGLDPAVRDILVMHEAFQHLLGIDGTYQLTALDIATRMPHVRVMVGDIHVNHHLPFNTLKDFETATGWIHSTGPLYPQDWGQTKLFCGVEVYDTVDDTWTKIPVRTRDWVSVDSGPGLLAELDRLQEAYVLRSAEASMLCVGAWQEDLPTAVRIFTSPETPAVYDPSRYPDLVFQEALKKVKKDDGFSLDATPEEEEGHMTVEDAIRAEADTPEEAELLLDLYRSDDPKRRMLEILREHKVGLRG